MLNISHLLGWLFLLILVRKGYIMLMKAASRKIILALMVIHPKVNAFTGKFTEHTLAERVLLALSTKTMNLWQASPSKAI